MQSYSEQFLLLSVDPVSGRLFPIPEKTLHLTLAGAILFDASFGGLINDDVRQLSILKTGKTSNKALDEALRCLMVVEQSIPLEKAIALVASHGSTLHRMVAEKLEDQGLLTRKKQRHFNKAQQTLFSPDLQQVVEIHSKIRNTIINDELPDPEIPPLISLMLASGLTKYVLKFIKLTRKLIANLNQKNGFECPGCAWPNPDDCRGHFAFCENGAKNVSAEATAQRIDATFFENWSVPELLLTPGYWLEKQGRLTEPMFLDENATHYKPISWDKANKVIAEELNKLDNPEDAVFYASGRTSNEAAFMYQLFARAYGSNNLPNSANLCHEPSGKALTMSLGAGKSSVSLHDFPMADAIFLFGHNPGSNHPRMLSTLQDAVRNGSHIVAINPMPEASLMGFADPQEAGSYFGKPTQLTRLYIQPKINGDMAFVRGMVKVILEEEKLKGNILDNEFIEKHTAGFDAYKQTVYETPWDLLVASSGVEKKQIKEAAKIYMEAEKVITSWCLGITHHRNSVETIQEIINLQLLKGNIGKPGIKIEWDKFENDYQSIRASISETIPIFSELEKKAIEGSEFYLENPLKKRIFKTQTGKAIFSNYPIETVIAKAGELLLMTIRSHDQFNTSVFGLNDRYRGISNERRILFMNKEDMSRQNIIPEQQVEITSNYENISRKLEGYYAIPYPIKQGCVAAYFPETNVLTSIDNTNKLCETPAYKSVCVRVAAVV